jgi:dCTP deaminase
MMLSDKTIREMLTSGTLVIDPAPKDQQLQPASVDLTLGTEFLSPYDDTRMTGRAVYTLLPGECIIATTAERVEIPTDVVARVEGKSSWGRKFLMVHSTAGFIDPGFRGQITLELKNLSMVSIALSTGCTIAQVSFQWLNTPAERPYGSEGLGSHYQDQSGATASAAQESPYAIDWPR